MTVNVTQPSCTGASCGSTTGDITTLAIIPGTQSVANSGQTAQFIAIGTTSSGATFNETANSVWTSSSTQVGTICSSGSPAPCTTSTYGLATAVGQGSTTITAIYQNADGTSAAGQASFTVTGASTVPLLSLSITPGTESILQGQSSQLIAIGNFSSTSATPGTQNLTSQVTWNSSNNSVATITAGGLLSAVGPGSAAITAIAPAADGNLVAVATITVTAPSSGTVSEPLTSLAIIPDTQSVAGVGQTTQFLAIGTFAASSTTPGTQNMANITTYTVKWYSSVPSVATIDPASGVATAVGNGTTAITAIATNNADKSASYATAALTVTGSSSQQVTSLAIIPGSQTITMPLTPPTTPTTFFAAIGTVGSTGLQVNETNAASWSSSNTAVATINATTGAVTPVGEGTTTITALYNNPSTTTTPASVVTATATLTVSGVAAEPLLSMSVLPGSQTISYPGQTSQLTAIGEFSEAPVTQNLTANTTTYPVTWISSNTAVATVCNAHATQTVPVSCAATPGLVTAVGQGSAAITAVASNTDGSVVTGVATITVTNGASQQITALTIIPSALSLSATGQPGQFTAIGTDGTTGLQEDVTGSPQLTWTASIPTYATVCTQAVAPIPANCPTTPGQAQGVSAGTTNITAEFHNPATTTAPASVVSATASVAVSVTPAAEPLLSITVLPTTVTDLNLEGTAQFLAYGTFSTAPTQLEITNGFSHPGFPVGCLTNCPFQQVNWISTAPFDFPINSAGTAGATGGLSTADASGNTDIYAVATNPDGTLVYSPMAVFNCPYAAPTYGTISVTDPATNITTTETDFNDLLNPGTCNWITIADSLLSTLTVFNASTTSTGVNQADWLITAPSATGTPNVIHCGGTTEQAAPGGSVCEATYPNGTQVTVTAPAEPGVNFGGWSSGCTPTVPVNEAGPNSCTVIVGGGCVLQQTTGTYKCSNSSNVSVGAIFN